MSARRPLLLPFLPLYSLGLSLKNLLHQRSLLPIRQLARPVISIGSLSAGGAGKTPVVIALAHLLAVHGIAADILSRGYGRTSTAIEQVAPGGSPSRFGDEPVEIANALAAAQTPVFVGANRFLAGTLAERSSHAQLHLLDDGFQHRQLARALDLVLLTAEDAADCLLPAGNLREPLSSLARAHAILLREEEAAALCPVVEAHTQAEIWLIRRTLSLPAARPLRPIAFCGIARPDGFLTMLSNAGCRPAETFAFPDHHAYTEADIARLLEAAQTNQADGFITTAKDAVKLTPAWTGRLEQRGRLSVASLEVTLLEPEAILRRIRGVLPHA